MEKDTELNGVSNVSYGAKLRIKILAFILVKEKQEIPSTIRDTLIFSWGRKMSWEMSIPQIAEDEYRP